ncbi:MAG TPA: UDP-N-acetylmuramoyl-tripeptide--D-alanyl-D-alanine ligase [Candidatus Dormibacteraeota bacterium]|nr:UDP-N-acetylmuramoyl-tripeptide--D-alanyl-D-alanine ligase [Candidatus Dormibacteraeota bacterium]
MEPRPLSFIVAACGGELVGGPGAMVVQRVCTDSRIIQKGDLFVALKGSHFDGHNFLEDVVKKGAAALLVERSGPRGSPSIVVKDARRALGLLAARYRSGFVLPVTAVAGSNGKTTTKDLVASVLSQQFRTLSSEASFNNDIGVPMTLLKLNNAHQAAVLEAGTNHPGELEPLLRLIRPRFGLMTSIGREHLEFFGDLAGVAREEGFLAEALPREGKLFINGDSEFTDKIAKRTDAEVVRLGFGPANDWRITKVSSDEKGTPFHVECSYQEFCADYRINLLGHHQAGNALFAIAMGAEMGMERAQIERGLAECQPAKLRMQIWEHDGVRVLDDSYNANADSMLAALRTLEELPCKGRRVAVLGDMAELGVESEASHLEIGRRTAELGIAQLFAVGKMAGVIARGAREAGLNRIFEFADVATAGSALKSFLKSGDVVLLKASRAMGLERIGQILKSSEASTGQFSQQ